MAIKIVGLDSKGGSPGFDVRFVEALNIGPPVLVEPGVDGFTIELVDTITGNIAATEVTFSIDVDGNGVIDPLSEIGLYTFENLIPGNYTIRQGSRSGWIQSSPPNLQSFPYNGEYRSTYPKFGFW